MKSVSRPRRAAQRTARKRGPGRQAIRRRAMPMEFEWVEETICYGASIPVLVKLLEAGKFE